MEKFLQIFILAFFIVAACHAQPANNNCVNAVTITVDGGCVSGTTQNATFQGGEVTTSGGCASTGGGCTLEQSVWYRFNTGTNTTLRLEVNTTNTPNCAGAVAVYG